MIYGQRYGRIVTLVRHGQATTQIRGAPGERLTEIGRRQAVQICEALSGFGLTRLVTSAMPLETTTRIRT